MELYAHIMSMNSYFIVRLKDKSYIDDRYEITENDAEIELELTKERLKKFNNKPKNNTRKWNNRILIN